MRLLLIDDSDADRHRIVAQLREAMPEAQVEEWAPALRGRPARDFYWPGYDAVLLSDAPRGEDGLEWLRGFRAAGTRVPPTLILAGAGGEDQAVRAVKAGAADFLRRSDLTGVRLAIALREALLDAAQVYRPGDTQTRSQPLNIGAIGKPAREDAVRVRGYKVLRRIGEGGMAKVYLAEREETRLQLVLKVLAVDVNREEQFLQRFLRECRIISKVQNEHVVAIYDHGVTEDCAFLAMEYFAGGDLKARIAGGVTSIQALKIVTQIARALEAVHAAGIVHRDLKPQNIMFREGSRLALVDFGLAKELDGRSTVTHTGLVLATPLYMSPEQYEGGRVDERSDLYSVGVILYEMLTGKPPFGASNAPALAYQHVNSPVPRLPQRLSGYQGIVDRLMAKRPEDRFQSARELFAYIAH
jgi:tRNA A-37 threonylcarbamoyl transferase component Bud32/CheY-like chemotaxis protein